MKKLNTIMAGLACLVLFCAARMSVLAAGDAVVMEHATDEQGVVLYVKGLPENYEEATYQIGTTEAAVESIQPLTKSEEPLRTLILWDNSLSVMKKYGTEIKEILIDIVANRAPGEEFAIASIDSEVTYLTDFTGDYTTLKQIVESVEGEDKDAYIIENVYEAILTLNNIQDCGYKRIILISDGMDDTEIGYSKAELDALIAQTPYPIYTIGVLSKGGETRVQDMFALSRTTNAAYYYLNEIEDPMSVVQGFSDDYSLMQVKATVPGEMQDGSTQNSQLTVKSGADSYTVTSQVTLPFVKKTEAETEETITEETVETVEETTAETEPMETEAAASRGVVLFGREIPLTVLIIAAVVLVVVIIIVVAIIICSRKKPKAAGNDYARLDQQIKNERYDAPAPQKPTPVAQMQENGNHTVLLAGAMGQSGQSSMGQNQEKGTEIAMVSITDPMKTYRCRVTEKITIGRKPESSDLVIEDPAVSGRHCELGISGGKFYLKDLGSSNGTYINGYKIGENVMTEVKTGCIVRLGNQDYRLEIG